MGFLSSVVGAVVKTALTPVALVNDVVKVATGEEPDSTKDLVKSAGKDIGKAVDSLSDGDIV